MAPAKMTNRPNAGIACPLLANVRIGGAYFLKFGLVMKMPSGMAIATTKTVEGHYQVAGDVGAQVVPGEDPGGGGVEIRVGPHCADGRRQDDEERRRDDEVDLVTNLRRKGGAILCGRHCRSGHAIAA